MKYQVKEAREEQVKRQERHECSDNSSLKSVSTSLRTQLIIPNEDDGGESSDSAE